MADLILNGMGGVRPINSETYTVQTYNFLRNAILKRELKEGEVYSQDQVSAMLNISRTPVREALLALQKEGYIRFLRGRGFEVVPYDETDVKNISEMRLIVEKAAAALAAQRIGEEQISALVKNIEAQQKCVLREEAFDIQEFLQLDDLFHQQIIAATGNDRLAKVIADMRNQWVRTGYAILQYGENRLDIFDEHRRIFEAVAAHDACGAELAMAAHMDNTQARRKAEKNNAEG